MSIIYTDAWPGAYAAGNLTVVDSHWSIGGPSSTNASDWSVTTGGGGNLAFTITANTASVYWSDAATWAPLSAGFWSEITMLTGLAGTVEIGPLCCMGAPGAGTASYYAVDMLNNATGFKFIKYIAGVFTQIAGLFTYATAPADGDVYALQVVNAGATNTLTFFQNYVANANTCTDTQITAGGQSGIFAHDKGTGSTIKAARGGTGLYPGNPAGNPTPGAARCIYILP